MMRVGKENGTPQSFAKVRREWGIQTLQREKGGTCFARGDCAVFLAHCGFEGICQIQKNVLADFMKEVLFSSRQRRVKRASAPGLLP